MSRVGQEAGRQEIDYMTLLESDAASNPQWTVIYDGDCGFCQWSAERLSRRFKPGAFRMVARQKAGSLGLPQARLEEGRGKVLLLTPENVLLGGHLAVMKVYEVTGWGFLARLLTWPPFGWLMAAGYWLIARNRHHISRIFFKNQACRLD